MNMVDKPQKIHENGSAGIIRDGLFFFISLILFALAVFLRLRASTDFFVSHLTETSTAHMLMSGYPPNGEARLFWELSSILLRDFFYGYVIPSAFLMSAIYCAWRGVDISGPAVSFLNRISAFRKKPVISSIVLILLLTALLLIMQANIVGSRYLSLDEFSYRFQSKILAMGRLYLDSPRPLDSFQTGAIISNGKWFSKYTIGWPLILILGDLIGFPWLVNCILGGVLVLVLFLTAREIYGFNTGIVASILLLLSPFFTFNCLVLLPHIVHLIFLMLFTWLYFINMKKYSPALCFFSGLILGYSLLIRPAETLIMGGVFFAFSIYSLVVSKDSRNRKLRGYGLMSAGFAIMLFITLMVNRFQTGSFLTFAFVMFRDNEVVKFGAIQHNAIRGLWNTMVSMTRLCFWIPPAVLGLSILSLLERRRENLVLFSFVLLLVAFFFSYYSLGVIEFGPRYYFVSMGFLCILGARGLSFIKNRFFSDTDIKGGTNLIAVFMLAISVFSLVAVYPPVLAKTAEELSRDTQLKPVEEKLAGVGKSVIFLRSSYDNSCYVLNFPGFDQERIYALFLDPETNEKVRALFPDRKFFILDYDRARGRTVVREDYRIPFQQRDRQTQLSDLMAGACNYAGVRNNEKARSVFRRASELFPDRADIALSEALQLMDMNRLKESEAVLKEILASHPDESTPWLALGYCYEKMKNYRESARAFSRYIPLSRDNNSRRKAMFWLEYLGGK